MSDIQTRIIELLKKKQSIELEKKEYISEVNADLKSIDSQIDNLILLYDEQIANADQQSLFPLVPNDDDLEPTNDTAINFDSDANQDEIVNG